MFEPTGSQRDAASAIFNLLDYRVRRASDAEDSDRRIEVESTEAPGCPQCGVLARRVHSRRRQRLQDVPVAGAVELIWLNPLVLRSGPLSAEHVQRGHRPGPGLRPVDRPAGRSAGRCGGGFGTSGEKIFTPRARALFADPDRDQR